MVESRRVFATCDIGEQALARLREKGYQLEVYERSEAPPKSLVVEKVRSGIVALITTLRDSIDEEVFAAGAAARLAVVAQMAVGFDNIDRAAANRHRIPFAHTPDVLTDATAEFAFFMLGAVARKLYPGELRVRRREWTTWHPYQPWLGDEVTGKTLAIVGMGRIGKSMVKKAIGFDMDVLCHDADAGRAGLRRERAPRACAPAPGGTLPARADDRSRVARSRPCAARTSSLCTCRSSIRGRRPSRPTT